MSNPLGLVNRLTRSFINRASRRQRENAASGDTDSAFKLSSREPLIFETLEPRLLLAADPLGITAGYAFDEVSGTSAADASGHSIVGTLTNGATFTAGKYGNAVTLDGTNDFVNLGNPTALQLTGNMTVSAWVYATSFPADDAAVVSKRTAGEIGYQLDITEDTGPRTIGFKLTDSSGGAMFRYGATALHPNTWYYVTGVYNAAAQTLDVYLNGALDNGVLKGTITSSQQNSPNINVTIGRRAGQAGYEFIGRIDDVRIADHALTPDQILTDMTTPLGGAPASDTTAPTITLTAPTAAAVAGTVTATASDNIGVPADRLYDWNPGLNSVGGVPNRTTVFTTVFPGGDIQAAIDAAPPDQVVQLAAGTFTVNNFLLINKGITLRGTVDPVTNAPLTFLQKTNGATAGSDTAADYQPIIIVGPSRYPQTDTSTNLTSDAVAGTYSITLASTAGLSPGQFVILDEDDYTSASFIALPNRNGSPTSDKILASDRVVFMDHNPPDPVDDPFPDSLTWFSRANRPLNELKEIASISGNTVTFTSPITITYTVSKQAQLTSFVDTFVKYAGIENLSLKGGSDGQIRFEAAAYSWMKNVEDTVWLGEGVAIDKSFRIEVRDSYIHDGAWSAPGGGGYAISLASASAEALIENNIILHANKMMVGRSAGAGTVVAYNYTDDGFIFYDPSWQEVGINGSHMVGSHSWLFEGNESFNYDSDNTHGNAIYMTVFRNNLTGFRSDFPGPDANARAVGLMFGSWWHSIIGNVLGTSGQMAGWVYENPGLGASQWDSVGPSIWKIGYDPTHWEQDADPKAKSTLIRGGNYDYVTSSVQWENIPSQTLPLSLYLSGKPAFFGSYTWPWVDPTGSTKLYILPAKARYDAGTPFALPPGIDLPAVEPAVIVFQKMYGFPPTDTQLDNLHAFDQSQFNYALSIGVQDPTLYVYEACGLAFAQGPAFQSEFGLETIQNDTAFATAAWLDIFNYAPNADQAQFVTAHVDFYETTYAASGAYGSDPNYIALLARGATYGLIIGLAEEVGIAVA